MKWIEDPSLSQRLQRHRILLFILSGLILVVGIGNPPVSRTQEARVLETARQMHDQPGEKWLIPELNGDVRLQKPPLPYWYTAIGFQLLGENEFAGRLPTALLAWATLLVTYLTASHVFDPRIGLLSSMMLVGGYLFARHSRLAETDLPATLFVTLAMLAVIRAMRDRTSLADLHLFAIGVGLTIVAKGGPAVFGVLFLFAISIIEHRWDLLKRFLRSGALVTLLLIALPWFIFAAHRHGLQTFVHELRNTAEGGDHSGSVFEYVGVLAWGAAPWSIALPIAVYHCVRRWKADWRLRTLLIWIACIALPLLLNGNKQKHYLLPMLPPVMAIVAWWMVEVWQRSKLALIIAGGMAFIMPLVVTVVAPGIVKSPARHIAARINQAHSQDDLRFYGDNFSPVLSFNMRKKIPMVFDASSAPPDATLLVIGKPGRPIVEPPAPFVLIEQFDEAEQSYAFYRRR